MTNNKSEMRTALERFSKEELVDLMEHILRIYVLDEPIKQSSNLSKPETIRELSGLSFAQLITLMQTNLDVEEFGKFRVTPYTVYVTIGEMEFDMNGPTPKLASDKAPAEETEDSADVSDDDDDEMSPAQRMDSVSDKPWRMAASAPKPKAPSAPQPETPSMADLFADNDRGSFTLNLEPPSPPEEDEDDVPPPIAEHAPGDVIDESSSATSTNFAQTAQSREDAPAAPPELPADEKQIEPSDRFGGLDIDF